MIFVKKQKENINMVFVDKIVRSYFKCLKENSCDFLCVDY